MAIEKLDDDSLARVVEGNSPATAMPDLPSIDPAQVEQIVNEISKQMAELTAPVTISGGSGQDVLIGGFARAEVFVGGGGADVMIGMDGGNAFLAKDGDRTGDIALGGAGEDSYVWGPGSGSDVFDGAAGDDTLALQNVTPLQLPQGVVPGGAPPAGCMLRVCATPNGAGMMLVNGHGQPQPFSGSFRIGGEVLVLSRIERITFPTWRARPPEPGGGARAAGPPIGSGDRAERNLRLLDQP